MLPFPGCFVGLAALFPYDDLRELAPQNVAYQVEVLEVDPFRDLVVKLIDGGWPYAGAPGKVSLRPPPLAKPCGQ